MFFVCQGRKVNLNENLWESEETRKVILQKENMPQIKEEGAESVLWYLKAQLS